MTPKAKELIETVKTLDAFLARGLTPFQAMAASLADDDWNLALVSFKTLVREASEV